MKIFKFWIIINFYVQTGASDKPRENHYKYVEFIVRNRNITSHVIQEFKYTLKINGTKQGLWIEGDDLANVQVIMVDGNFTVLTFCEKAQLTSFVLSREKHVNATEVIDDAHYLLERRGLTIESVEALCKGSSVFSIKVLILLATFVSTKLLR